MCLWCFPSSEILAPRHVLYARNFALGCLPRAEAERCSLLANHIIGEPAHLMKAPRKCEFVRLLDVVVLPSNVNFAAKYGNHRHFCAVGDVTLTTG